MPKKRSGHLIRKLVIAAVVLAVAGYFAYSLRQYYSEGADAGIMTCDAQGQNCKLSVHVHADVDASVCGQKIRFPLETGALDDAHTHKEPGKIHLHTTLPYDPATDTILDTRVFTLGRFMDNMGVRLTSTCLGDKCNGDDCNGHPGTLMMTVNDQFNSQFRDYVWHDHDEITLTFQ
jgi:hypothetical protein